MGPQFQQLPEGLSYTVPQKPDRMSILNQALGDFLKNQQEAQQNNVMRGQLQQIMAGQNPTMSPAPSSPLQALINPNVTMKPTPIDLAIAEAKIKAMSYPQQGIYTLDADGKPVLNGYVAKGDKVVNNARSGGNLSPVLQKAKDTRAEAIFTNIEQNNIKRSMIADAAESAKKIQGGVYGKISRGTMRNLDPNNPILGDWQKIKMVLTDAQLMNTAKTKGAISDQEMALFSKAAANDDMASLPAMIPVFNKVLNVINGEETGAINSYRKLYNDDPYGWEGISSNINDIKLNFNETPYVAQSSPKPIYKYPKIEPATGDTRTGKPFGKYYKGQIINAPNGKKYMVIGGDLNDPDVEEIK